LYSFRILAERRICLSSEGTRLNIWYTLGENCIFGVFVFKIEPMIKTILKVLAVLVIGIVVYNFFFGTPEEKQQSREIFQKGKELVVSAKDLLQSEKEKFDAGKYDDALDKIGSLFNDLKDKANEFDQDYLDRISELEQRRQELERQLASEQVETYNRSPRDSASNEDTPTQRELKRKLDELLKDTDNLMREMENSEGN